MHIYDTHRIYTWDIISCYINRWYVCILCVHSYIQYMQNIQFHLRKEEILGHLRRGAHQTIENMGTQ